MSRHTRRPQPGRIRPQWLPQGLAALVGWWLLRSVIPAGACFAVGWRLLMGIGPGGMGDLSDAFIGLGLVVLTAILLAPMVSRLIAMPSGALFYPQLRARRPAPMYNQAESRRKEGRFDEAMDLLQAIAEKYPRELRPYLDMIEIAFVDLRNPKLANATYQRAMRSFTKRRDRRLLEATFNTQRERLAWWTAREMKRTARPDTGPVKLRTRGTQP